MSKEIGGYIELDTYRLPMLHEGALALNCGRNALAYLICKRGIRKLRIPRFICDSVTGVCEREGAAYSFYEVGLDFLPSDLSVSEMQLEDGEWFYLVNYYSQLDQDMIARYARMCGGRIIVDLSQSYFQEPLPHVDSLYTCRKYFGVADGAFLYTDVERDELPRDESFERMHFLLGRYERGASEFYGEYVANNDLFVNEPVKAMSRLTWNLLHGIDYRMVEERRLANFGYLQERLKAVNQLERQPVGSQGEPQVVRQPVNLQPVDRQEQSKEFAGQGLRLGTFMYPLLIDGGVEVRKMLQARKIYIPTLWPDVFQFASPGSIEYRMAQDILPLPIDQRYGTDVMEYLVQNVLECMDY